jgi:hypothetical protein
MLGAGQKSRGENAKQFLTAYFAPLGLLVGRIVLVAIRQHLKPSLVHLHKSLWGSDVECEL